METATLETLAARQDIVDVITELFVATDQRDWGAVKRCFADQVLFDMSSLGAGPPARRNTRVFVGSYAFILDRGGPLGWRISTFRFDLKFIDGNANLESDGNANLESEG